MTDVWTDELQTASKGKSSDDPVSMVEQLGYSFGLVVCRFLGCTDGPGIPLPGSDRLRISLRFAVCQHFSCHVKQTLYLPVVEIGGVLHQACRMNTISSAW
jgi:hypothetical protein